MDELDLKDWELFRANPKSHISHLEYKLVAELHAKYFKHSFYLPCKCSPKTINQWIAQINDLYERDQTDKQI